MAYYCGECAIWQGSGDVNRYGERWCPYSNRYEKSDQNTYGCRGFVYAQRAILTKVCEILSLPTEEYFRAFDEVKEKYLVPQRMDLLVAYSAVGPMLAEKLDRMENRAEIAKGLMEKYIEPAKNMTAISAFANAVALYCKMVVNMQAIMN